MEVNASSLDSESNYGINFFELLSILVCFKKAIGNEFYIYSKLIKYDLFDHHKSLLLLFISLGKNAPDS